MPKKRDISGIALFVPICGSQPILHDWPFNGEYWNVHIDLQMCWHCAAKKTNSRQKTKEATQPSRLSGADYLAASRWERHKLRIICSTESALLNWFAASRAVILSMQSSRQAMRHPMYWKHLAQNQFGESFFARLLPYSPAAWPMNLAP